MPLSKQIKLAFDLDNVCVNTTECMINYINQRLPFNLKMEDITTYSIEAALPEQYRWIVESGFRDKEMWKSIQFLDHCIEVLESLYYEGYDIHFATSSLPENLRKKINHLSRNMHFFPEGYVQNKTININEKYLLIVDILTDDCLKHIIDERRTYYSIVMDYPWNRDSKTIELPCIARANDWLGIYDRIHTITDLIREKQDE